MAKQVVTENMNREKAKELQGLLDIMVIQHPELRGCHVGLGRAYVSAICPCVLLPVHERNTGLIDEHGINHPINWIVGKSWSCSDVDLEYITVNGFPSPHIPVPISVVLQRICNFGYKEAWDWDLDCVL